MSEDEKREKQRQLSKKYNVSKIGGATTWLSPKVTKHIRGSNLGMGAPP